jgi:hypothetical protein
MTLNVVYDNLTAAANSIEGTVEPMASYSLLKMCYAQETIGHQELAGWIDTIGQGAEEMGGELFVAMTEVATALDFVATYFSATDDAVEMCFAKDPMTTLGLPEGYNPGPPSFGPAITSSSPTGPGR